MEERGFLSMIVSVLLVGLFIYCMIAFATQFQHDMGASDTILNTSVSNLNRTYGFLEVNLTSAEDTASSSRTSFEGEEVLSEGGSLILKSIVGVGKSFTGTILSFFSTIFDLIMVVFGLGGEGSDNNASFTIVIGVVTSIVVTTLIFYAWRVYRAGS